MADVEITRGDLSKSDAEALVNTVNCVGVMGKGLALQFKRAFPANFRVYKRACDAHELAPGKVLVVEYAPGSTPRYIINFPTKVHWRGDSQLAWIQSGLTALIGEVPSLGITSIAVPPLGCGNGGLDWADVRPMIEVAFASVPHIRVVVFEPAGAPRLASHAITADGQSRSGAVRSRQPSRRHLATTCPSTDTRV